MFKKISAAVIAASLLTAPAFAATAMKTERAPATKSVTIKPSVANAKAQVPVVKKVHRHHRKHFTHRHARKHMAVVKNATVKRVSTATPAKTVIVKKKI
ncbi:MAG: hypothetical protein J0I29_06980 [Rhizobiales bacterium]|nr:hypothetical protein [Hyphomicrobiales bacterium]